MDKILVIGINGFSGIHFQDYVEKNSLAESFLFVGTSRRARNATTVPTRIVDPLKGNDLEGCLLDVMPQYIINFVGSFSSDDFALLLDINANVSRRICETVLRNRIPVKKLLLIGSAAEYGRAERLPIAESDPARPVTFYGLTKLFQTAIASFYSRNHGIPVVVARPFNVLGKDLPTTLSVGNFVHQILNNREGEPVRVGNLDSRRDFLDVEDVLDGYWKILMKGREGEIYNICRGESVAMREIVGLLLDASGKDLPVAVQQDLIKKNDFMDSYGDHSKLSRHTGWIWRIGIQESVTRTLRQSSAPGEP